jgi:FixJ family two-component response regulator
MEHIVYVVDDDHAVRRSVVGLESAGLNALDFSSADLFCNTGLKMCPPA